MASTTSNPLPGPGNPLTGTGGPIPLPLPAHSIAMPTKTLGLNASTSLPTHVRPSEVMGDQTSGRPIRAPRGPRRNGDVVDDSIIVGVPSPPVRHQQRKSPPQTKTPPKSAKVPKKTSAQRKHQESSDKIPLLTDASASPPSIVEAPNTPQDGINRLPGATVLTSPRQTPQQQAQDEPEAEERPRKCQRKLGNFRKCTRCESLFEMRPPVPRGITVPDIPQSAWNERTNLFCARCFMRLYICEAVFKKNRLKARYKQDVKRLQFHPDSYQNWGEVMESVQFLYQSLASIGSDVVKAAQNPKTRELFEKEGELRGWSRIIRNLDLAVSGRPTEEVMVRLSGEEWRSDIDKWISIAARMLLHTFFDQESQKVLQWQCGGFCNFCKPRLQERNDRVAVQQAILRGDQELPGQPSSFDRLYMMTPWNPDGTHTQHPFISNIDGLGYRIDRAPAWFDWHVGMSQVNFDDWVVEYDKWKGYDEALQDNIDMFSALP